MSATGAILFSPFPPICLWCNSSKYKEPICFSYFKFLCFVLFSCLLSVRFQNFQLSDGLDVLVESVPSLVPPPWRSHDFFPPFILFACGTMDMMFSDPFFFFEQCTWWTFSNPLFQLNVGHGEPCCSLPFLTCAFGVMVPPQGAMICSPQKYYSSRAKQGFKGGVMKTVRGKTDLQ